MTSLATSVRRVASGVTAACALAVLLNVPPTAAQDGAPRTARRAPQARTPTTPAASTTLALVGGTVHPGDGPVIENATVLVRDERIVSVTPGGPVPEGATPIDARGMIITPGLISTMTSLGLHEIELEGSTQDTGLEGDAGASDPIRASFSAADGYNPLSTLIPVARLGGVTTAMSVPEGGLVQGTSAWVDLAGRDPSRVIARAALALHVHLDDEGFDAAGGARSAALTALRELLDDARLFSRQRSSFDRGEFRDSHASRLDLERVSQALSGELPVVVRTARSTDILRAIDLAEEFGFRLILAGCEEGWMVASRIAAAHVPVIVEPMTNLPTRFSTLHTRYENAAILSQAGVQIVLMAPGAWDVRNLRQEAGNAVAYGMDRGLALAAITSAPAAVFGMDADYGTVAPGRLANLVVWSGDPFEMTSVARRVFVRGREMPLRSRQTMLLERYRSLGVVARGYRGIPAADPMPSGEGDAVGVP